MKFLKKAFNKYYLTKMRIPQFENLRRFRCNKTLYQPVMDCLLGIKVADLNVDIAFFPF